MEGQQLILYQKTLSALLSLTLHTRPFLTQDDGNYRFKSVLSNISRPGFETHSVQLEGCHPKNYLNAKGQKGRCALAS